MGHKNYRMKFESEMRELPPTLEVGSPKPPEITETELKNPSTLECIKNFVRNITVEPIVMLLVTPRLLCNLTNENLNLEKACYVNLGFNDSICYAMIVRNQSGYTASEEVAVQRVVSSLLPYKQALHILQLITLLVVSSWCDRSQKVKPMFYIPFFGDISALLGYIICVYFFMEISVEYSIFIEGILTVAFGGFQLLLAGSFSYVASITDAKSRTVRIGAVVLVARTCMTLGIALSGYTYKFLGFYGVYCIALSMNLLGVGYAVLTIKNIPAKERIKKEVEENSCCWQVLNGTWNTLYNSIGVCLKKASGRRRTKMITLQLINFIAFGIMSAEYAVTYLFSRKQFGWDEVDYSIYKAYKTVVEVGGCSFVLACLSKYLQWSDASIGMLSAACRIFGAILLAFSDSGLMFYLSTLNDLLSASILISVRSMITKVVDQNEQAVANSMTAVVDSVGLFVIGPLYSYIYYSTVAFFPGAFFLFSSLMNIPNLILFYVLYRLQNQ